MAPPSNDSPILAAFAHLCVVIIVRSCGQPNIEYPVVPASIPNSHSRRKSEVSKSHSPQKLSCVHPSCMCGDETDLKMKGFPACENFVTVALDGNWQASHACKNRTTCKCKGKFFGVRNGLCILASKDKTVRPSSTTESHQRDDKFYACEDSDCNCEGTLTTLKINEVPTCLKRGKIVLGRRQHLRGRRE